MRILHAKIYGFGKWVDYSIDFPKTGPFFIYGENESGKTTFYQFILFMLFGMPPRQRKFYQPKTSSKLGGQLIVEDENTGLFTIERLDDKNNGAAICYTETGEQLPEDWLVERMHQMNKKTFEAVFSFSALDLNNIVDMDETDLGEVLLSIGLTGSDNIYRVEKQLDARLDALFKPTGRKPEMNVQLNELDALKNELEEKRKETASYQEKVLKAEELLKRLNTLQKEQKQTIDEISFLTKKHTTLPIIQEYQFLYKKKMMIQDLSYFPENGFERLEKIKEGLLPLESELAVLKNNKARYNDIIERNHEDLLSKELLQELQQHRSEIEDYNRIRTKLEKLRNEEREQLNEISEELDHLQIHMQQPELKELTIPFYIEETWKQLQVDHSELEREHLNLQSEKTGLEKELQYVDKEYQQLGATLLSDSKLKELKSRLEQGKEYKQLNRLYDETLKMKSNVERDKKGKFKRGNQLLGLSIILFFISIVAAYFTDQNLFYGLGLFLLLGGISQWIFTRQSIRQLEAMLQQPMYVENKASVSEEEMFVIEKKLKEEEAKQIELQRLEIAIQDLRINHVKWEEKERIHLERKQRLEQQMEEQIVLYPFLEKIHLSYWPEYYRRIKYILKQNDVYNEIAEEINLLQHEQKIKKDELFTFWKENFPDEKLESIEAIEHSIQEKLKKETEIKERTEREKELLQNTLESISSLSKRIAVYQKEIKVLLNTANAETEEEFYKLGNDVLEKSKIEKALEVNERQLEAAFPEGPWKDFTREAIDEVDLKQMKDEKANQAEYLEQEIEKKRSELAELQAELRRLESSDAYSEKLHLFEMEKEKLNQQAKEWAVLKIEKEILTETKQSYREKYLSKVLDKTANIFQVITGGKYIDVLAPRGKELFQILAADGLRYTINELSQGTVNQLYVSLRIAISKVMTEKKQLPFILDDAFVHFDKTRVKRMLKVLEDIGSEQQVIMFTCKSDVRNACEELGLPISYILEEIPSPWRDKDDR